MAEKVNIPISVLDYTADYIRTVIGVWLDRAALVQAMFDALLKWNLNVNNVDPIMTGKPSEQGIRINLPDVRSSFYFGPASCSFKRDGVDWASANETIEILKSCLDTLTGNSPVRFQNQKVAISFHIQPKTKSFMDILNPLLSPGLKALRSETVTTGASIVKWGNGRITLDGSAAIANALYVRIEHEFEPSIPFEEMATTLRNEENALFELLGIEEAS